MTGDGEPRRRPDDQVAYLVATRLGTEPEVRLLGDFAAGTLRAEPVAAADWLRMAELVAR